jgi:hypothetical protein
LNANPRPRLSRTFHFTFIATLLAALGLVIGFAPSSSANVAPESFLATQFFDVIGGGDALFLVSSGAVLHTPEGDYTGRAGLSQFGNDLGTSFSNLAFTTDSVEYVDALVIIHFTLSGVSTGSYHGLTANCGGISAPGVAVLRVGNDSQAGDAGIVLEQWVGYDSDALASQVAGFAQWPAVGSSGCIDSEPIAPAPAYVPPPMYEVPTCDKPY